MERCPMCYNVALLGDLYDCGHKLCRDCLERRAVELPEFFCPLCNVDCEYFRISDPKQGPYGEDVLVINDIKDPIEEDLCGHTICLWCCTFKSQMCILDCGCNVCERCIREELKINRTDDFVWCIRCESSLVGSFTTKFGSFKIKIDGSLEMKRWIQYEVAVEKEIKQEPGLESTIGIANRKEEESEEELQLEIVEEPQNQLVVQAEIRKEEEPEKELELEQQSLEQPQEQPPVQIAGAKPKQKRTPRRRRKGVSILAPLPPLKLGALMVLKRDGVPAPWTSGKRKKAASEEERKERKREQNRLSSQRYRAKHTKALLEITELRKEMEELKKSLK